MGTTPLWTVSKVLKKDRKLAAELGGTLENGVDGQSWRGGWNFDGVGSNMVVGPSTLSMLDRGSSPNCPAPANNRARYGLRMGVAVDYGFVNAIGGESAARAAMASYWNDIGILYRGNVGVDVTIGFLEVRTSATSGEKWNDAPSSPGSR